MWVFVHSEVWILVFQQVNRAFGVVKTNTRELLGYTYPGYFANVEEDNSDDALLDSCHFLASCKCFLYFLSVFSVLASFGCIESFESMNCKTLVLQRWEVCCGQYNFRCHFVCWLPFTTSRLLTFSQPTVERCLIGPSVWAFCHWIIIQ